jgi:ECF transporter S component (folate family)
MNNIVAGIRESYSEIKNVKSMTGSAMLTALNVILDFVRIVVSNLLEISFAFLALAVAGMLYGPVMAGIVGMIADVIAYFVKPNGPFFIGFTINSFLSGFIYGLFLYRKKITLKRVIAACLCETVVINFILTPIWLNMMYGTQLFTIVRIIKNIAIFPINVALLCLVCKTVETVKLKTGLFEK